MREDLRVAFWCGFRAGSTTKPRPTPHCLGCGAELPLGLVLCPGGECAERFCAVDPHAHADELALNAGLER